MCSRRSAFTLVELLVVIAIIALLISIMLPALGHARRMSRQLKCETNIRAIMQANVVWAQSNDDSYPLPSAVDVGDTTVTGLSTTPTRKDCTKNIYSLLIFNGYITPEMCVTPAEENGLIKPYRGYAYSEPPAAMGVDKSRALWDPAFRATQISQPATGTNGDIGQGVSATVRSGGVSYAHTLPLFNRRLRWKNTFASTEATLGNRGPEYTQNGSGSFLTWKLTTTAGGVSSTTLLIHGTMTSWQGNIAFNDNHCEFIERPDPESVKFDFRGLSAGFTTQRDNIFVNENDSFRSMDSNILLNTNAYFVIVSSGAIGATSATCWRD